MTALHAAPDPQPTRSQIACVSTDLPGHCRTSLAPSSTILTHNRGLPRAQQIELAEKTIASHTQLDQDMESEATQASIDPACPRLKEANHIAHQALTDLLPGTTLLRVCPHEVNALTHELASLAHQHVKGLQAGEKVCHDTLKQSIHRSPKVHSFKQKHLPTHGHRSHMDHHPVTGVASTTNLAPGLVHEGTAETAAHGHLHHSTHH